MVSFSVRALVLEKGSVRVAIVNVDNLGWSAALGNKSRKLIKGIPPGNVLIGATHTHSGPDAYGFPNEKGESFADLTYLDHCVVQIADAVNEAVQKPGRCFSEDRSGGGKGVKSPITTMPTSCMILGVRVIQAIAASVAKKGQPIATLVNYAIHPEVIGSGRVYSALYIFVARFMIALRQEEVAMAVFMNGALGWDGDG